LAFVAFIAHFLLMILHIKHSIQTNNFQNKFIICKELFGFLCQNKYIYTHFRSLHCGLCFSLFFSIFNPKKTNPQPMKIIADGGATKSNWCMITPEGKRVYFNTEGYNPYFIDTQGVIKSLNENLPSEIDFSKATEIYYYGSGVHNQERAQILVDAFQAKFVNATVYVGHDLLAAARALLQRKAGFAAILGTGTNSCIYDGSQVAHHIDSLAYFLGDEGSGCHIGKRVLSDYMRGYMPAELHQIFKDTYKLTSEDILETLYYKPNPNRFLSSFSKFVYDHNNFVEYTRSVVKDCFAQFFKNLVVHYPDYQSYTFNCVGSVGYNFRDILTEVANENGMEVGKIIRSPIDDLVQYHLDS
jgi:N-acetylglucosamine kinase-like BadF-type ATPase